MSKSFYKIFEISETATDNEIKKAFRRLSNIYHPDKNPPEKNEWATRNFQEISYMKETLLDKDKRKKHDTVLKAEQERLRKEESERKRKEKEGLKNKVNKINNSAEEIENMWEKLIKIADKL